MRRFFVCVALVSLFVALVGACDDGGYYYSAPGGRGGYGYCRQYESCGSCTPVVGCGWCTGPTGAGVCAASPDECPTQEFSWTWDPVGCRTAADAGIGGESDGASSVSDVGTSAGDSGEAQDTSTPSDAEVGEGSSPCGSLSGDASADVAPCD